jgi:hypothetical protein
MKTPQAVDSIHSQRSTYREMLIEHLFAGELMRHYWRGRGCLLEVAKPQVDDGGYDLVLEANGIVRYVQLKSTHRKSKLGETNVALSLGQKPSGCVIIIRFDEGTLSLGPFHFFGGGPGEPLPDIRAFNVARGTRYNRNGKRPERLAHRRVPISKFKGIESMEALAEKLFGCGGGS